MSIICLCTIVRSDFHLRFSRKQLTTYDIPLHYSSFHEEKEGIIIKKRNKRLNTFFDTNNISKTDNGADINNEELPWQIYDRIFKRIFSLSDTAIINGLFHEHFPPNSDVAYPNKEYVNPSLKSGYADVIVIINNIHAYHLEAQTSPDGIIVLRVFEYGFQYALLSKTQNNILRFPEPVVIYLNEEEAIPEESVLHISFGSQGTFNYRIRNYCYFAHDIEELDSKKMVVLIPFQVMRLRSLLKKIKQPETQDIPFDMNEFNRLRDEIKADIIKSIDTNQRLGNITYDDARQLIELTNQLYQRICADIRKIGGPKDMRPLLPGAFELPNDKYRLRIAALEEENARYADEITKFADENARYANEITLLRKRITELEAGSE